MKAIVQRVLKAQVKVGKKTISQIKKGYLVFIGFCQEDKEDQVVKMADKIANLRIMPDEKGKMNINLKQAQGEILVVSQFTLCADTSQRRPSFIKAKKNDEAKKLYLLFIKKLKEKNLEVKEGEFGSYMEVELINDGPTTIILNI